MSQPPEPSSMSVEQQIVASIRRIVRAVDLHSKKLVESCGMTGPQLATLQVIHRLGQTTPGTIARHVHLSQGTITGILYRLERRGLVARRKSETDRRGFIIEITGDGRALLESAPSLLQDKFRAELTRLHEWERLMILSTLQRVAGLMGAETLDASPYLVTEEVGASEDDAANATSQES